MKTLYMTMILSAFALNINSSARAESISKYQFTNGDFRPVISFGAGHIDERNQGYGGDSFGASFIGNIYYPNSNWMPDVGLGFIKVYSNDGLQTTIGVLSLDARYALAQRWSIGPIADVYLSNGSNLGSTGNQSLFVGAIAFKEFFIKRDELFKVGLKADTQLFAASQASNYVGFLIDFTFPSSGIEVR
jgi:hypothetical protein